MGEGDPVEWWGRPYEDVNASGLRTGTYLDMRKIVAFSGASYGESRRQMGLEHDYRIMIKRLPTIMIKIVLENPKSKTLYNSFDKDPSDKSYPAKFNIFSFENGTAIVPEHVYAVISNDTRGYLLPVANYSNAHRLVWDTADYTMGNYDLRIVAINGNSFGQASVGVNLLDTS